MKLNYKKISNFILILLIIVGYSILFIGATFTNPNAEDFSLSATAKNIGVAPSIIEVLISYDGRYFSNFLHAINPLAFGWINGYKWMSFFSLVFPVFILFFFLRSFRSIFNKYDFFVISSFFMLINYALTPSLPHLVFWMSSSFVYLYSWCFMLLWLGFFIRFYKEENEKKSVY